MGGGLKGFEDLPEFCVIEILRRCEEEDILNFQSVSNWACSIARIPSLWKGKIEEQYRVDLPHKLASSYAALQKLHRWMGGTKEYVAVCVRCIGGIVIQCVDLWESSMNGCEMWEWMDRRKLWGMCVCECVNEGLGIR